MTVQPQCSLWKSLASTSTASTTNASHFNDVMSTLLQSPNITSSLLFRAEIFYDSSADPTVHYDALNGLQNSSRIPHLKTELRPRGLNDTELQLDSIPGKEGLSWSWQRTVVRNLVPRNPARDKPLVQSCWYFECQHTRQHKSPDNHCSFTSEADKCLVLYVPHVAREENIPYYHPAVKSLAIIYDRGEELLGAVETPSDEIADSNNRSGSIDIACVRFNDNVEAPLRLGRTALNMATIIAKHMAGRADGYVKRVHHDRIIPQKAFQDTYTRLKLKYAKGLVDMWVEQTDPTKHVFEDLGIAAFLIELWRDMYNESEFPGFVDFGCGNGLLVFLLRSEGYDGWGFDLVGRKTWDALPQDVVHRHLKEKICFPRPLLKSMPPDDQGVLDLLGSLHDGTVPAGTFIISNHADELTLWTPLLAYISNSPFIAIPCCSHDFGGSKFRARGVKRGSAEPITPATPQVLAEQAQKSNGVETGTLQKRNPKQPSAYEALCTYLEYLTEEVGLVPEKEMLRIPSTRNAAVVGRKSSGRHRDMRTGEHGGRQYDQASCTEGEVSESLVHRILEKEMGQELSGVARVWFERAVKASKLVKTGH